MTGLYQSILNFLFWKLLLILKREPYWLQIVIFFCLSISINIVTAPFILMINHIAQDGDARPNANAFTALILAPILETLVFQHLTYKLFQVFSATRGKYLIYILLSSLLFGSLHSYSLSYMASAFTMGLVLNYIYFFYSKNIQVAFWSTAFIHFLRNLLVRVGVFVFNYID